MSSSRCLKMCLASSRTGICRWNKHVQWQQMVQKWGICIKMICQGVTPNLGQIRHNTCPPQKICKFHWMFLFGIQWCFFVGVPNVGLHTSHVIMSYPWIWESGHHTTLTQRERTMKKPSNMIQPFRENSPVEVGGFLWSFMIITGFEETTTEQFLLPQKKTQWKLEDFLGFFCFCDGE